MKPLRVLIVGCGNIAGGFDRDRIKDDYPYTHAGAYSRDKRFCLTACVEPDDARRTSFMAIWGISIGFCTLEEVVESNYRFDVISVCSSTSSHANDLDICLQLKPKLIFCEKPITTSCIEAERLVYECQRHNILLVVNYSRRFDPGISQLQVDIKKGQWGQLRSVVGCYNKGVLNNGSHMIDLLHFLLGPMKVVVVGKPVHDFFKNDPSVPVWLEDKNGVLVQISCGHAVDYSIFEIQFVFSQGILTMEGGGLFWRERRIVESNVFEGYRVPNQGVWRLGEYPRAMMCSIDNIYSAITNNEPIKSTGDSALLAQRMCEKIIQLSIAQ